MKRTIATITILSLLIIAVGCSDRGQAESSPPVAQEKVERPLLAEFAEASEEAGHVLIDPRMELMAGVLSQTSWIDRRGPEGEGNAYYRELKAFFEPYRDHEAVEIAERLTGRGFTYDAPPHLALRFGDLPSLARPEAYGDYLTNRAGGVEELEAFRKALIDLYEKSDFDSFFDDHREDYASYLTHVVEGYDAQSVIDWMTDFYGLQGDSYYVVLAPAMFPGGGYGATIEKEEGVEIYQVVRASGTSEEAPAFISGNQLALLTNHEWGHSFVNPAVDEHLALVKVHRLQAFFNEVAHYMEQQAYPKPSIFFNEQILRAVTILWIEETFGEEIAEKQIAHEESRAFYLTRFTVERLREYRADRDAYPTFNDFIPELFKAYDVHREELLSLAPEGGTK